MLFTHAPIMRQFYLRTFAVSALACVAFLTGCASSGSSPGVFHHEEFVSTNVHSQKFPGSGSATCEAARRALLSQGYVISIAKADLVKGQKNFQPEGDVHVQIEFHVTCAPNSKGSNSTTLFVNALEDRYTLKKSSNSASIGVGVLGSVSLPFGSSDESLVKVASETIVARRFYKRFFALVESYLDSGGIAPDETTDSVDSTPRPLTPDVDS